MPMCPAVSNLTKDISGFWTRLDEVACAGNEVGERVALFQELSILVPVGTQLPTAPHVRKCPDEPPAAYLACLGWLAEKSNLCQQGIAG